MDKQKPLNDIYPDPLLLNRQRERRLHAWYETYAGQAAIQQLAEPLERMTTDVFGYYALEFGLLAERHSFLTQSRIPTRLRSHSSTSSNLDFVALPEALPLEFSELDLLIASHVLELSDQPHQVLREIERVLVPEGHCILVGFNRWSLRGLNQFFKWAWGQRGSEPRFYSPWRVKDWFEVLGFEVLELVILNHRPNMGGMRSWYAMSSFDKVGKYFKLPTGNLYILHVRKKVSTLTPLELKPKRRRVALLKPVAGVAVKQNPLREQPHE